MRDRLRRVFSVADLSRPSRQSYQKYDSFVPRYDSRYDSAVDMSDGSARRDHQSYQKHDSIVRWYDSWHDSVVPQHDSWVGTGPSAEFGQVSA
jgi:hypothetical protein